MYNHNKAKQKPCAYFLGYTVHSTRRKYNLNSNIVKFVRVDQFWANFTQDMTHMFMRHIYPSTDPDEMDE